MHHTPGPWQVGMSMRSVDTFDDPETGVTEIVDDDGVFVACVNHPNPEHEANARLIAAAPELLGACEDALAFLHQLGYHSTGNTPVHRLACAIATAKGGTDGTTPLPDQ